MEVTSENRYIKFKLDQEFVDGWGYCTSEIPHNRTWCIELLNHLTQTWDNSIGSLGRHLPCTEYPSTPSGECHEERSSTILTGSIDVEWPTAIFRQYIPKLFYVFIVKFLNVAKKELSQVAYLTGGQHDSVIM